MSRYWLINTVMAARRGAWHAVHLSKHRRHEAVDLAHQVRLGRGSIKRLALLPVFLCIIV
jgi:hypothetical protein